MSILHTNHYVENPMYKILLSPAGGLLCTVRLILKYNSVRDNTLNISKAVIAPVGHPDVASNPGWGEDDILAMFMPLLIHPKVSLEQEEKELD